MAAKRILVVEDHADTARVMQKLLQLDGYEVDTVAGVKDARAICKRKEFDLVLSDIGLQDGDGVDPVHDLIKECNIMGVAITGYGLEEDIERAKKAGFLEVLIKPITLDTLKRTLARVFDGAT